MADNTALVQVTNVWSPGFIEELLPCSQQISQLYNLSYLCLAKFPKLERLIRMRAVETQLLFGSSEAVMLKCVGTSQNLVSSLFPMLIHSIEKNRPVLAVRYLEKARNWIQEIINDVDKMAERYLKHNQDVATTTSDVITEKDETDKKLKEIQLEIEAMEKVLQEYRAEMNNAIKEMTDIENQIDGRNRELQDHIRRVASQNRPFSIFAAIVPFIGPIVQSIYNWVKNPGAADHARALETEINRLVGLKGPIKQRQLDIHVKIIDQQMKLTKIKMDKGCIPDPIYLGDVQCYLTRIQEILIRLKLFWEKVYSLLGTIKDQTFLNELLIEEPGLKEVLLESIKSASEVWKLFGEGCGKAVQIFRVQSLNAYKFLEVNPSSLSKEAWQKQYESVKQKLQEVKVTEVARARVIS